MKVLMVAATPFFSDRGAHTQIYEQINSLKKKGIEVQLLTYGIGRDISGIETVRIPNILGYNKISAGPSFIKFLLLPILYLAMARIIKSFKPDVVHAHMFEGLLLIKIYKKVHRSKLPAIGDLQGTLDGELIQHKFIKKNSLMHKLYKLVESKLLAKSNIITQSDQMVDDFKSRSKDIKSIVSVYDGVDTDRFSPRKPDKLLAKKFGIDLGRPRLLFMGVFTEYQGLNLLFESIKILIRKVPDLQLIAIGYPNVEKYKNLARELKIEKNIIFLGKINYFDIQNYLALSDIAIAPKISETEGDGKIYNYMAMGQAVVAFDRPISKKILADCGLIAEFKNSQDLAKQILSLLMNPIKVQELGTNARNRAIELYSWDSVADRILNQYNSLLRKNYIE